MEMKNRLPIIILAVALLISLGGNVYLITKQSALNNQLTDTNNLLTEANNRIADANNLLTEANNQIADLQNQLNQYNEQIETLENALAEKDAQIEADKALMEQIKRENEAREKGETPQSTEKPQVEKKDFEIPEEYLEGFRTDISDIPVDYTDDGSTLFEGGSFDSSGYIGH